MEIPFSRWYSAVAHRRSRRRFEPKAVELHLLARLSSVCAEFRPFEGARAALVAASPEEVFKGIIGRYGMVRGATAFVAFIGNRDDRHVAEKVGYTGEGIILEATSLNLGTCWVGGFFRPKVAASIVGVSTHERVLAVTPIGYASEDWSLEERIMTGFGGSHRRKPLTELVTGLRKPEWPLWMKEALEAARCAPSAVNRQPWRFHLEGDSITISVDNLRDSYSISKRLDCGIAMLHIEVASLKCDVKGAWELLDAPDVARWKVGNP